jgi:hypothetical protein
MIFTPRTLDDPDIPALESGLQHSIHRMKHFKQWGKVRIEAIKGRHGLAHLRLNKQPVMMEYNGSAWQDD